MPKLSQAEIDAQLQPLVGWEQKDNEISRKWLWNDFSESMAFANRVAALAEAADHHPDMLIRYNKVTLTLSTHSDGGLTTKDFELARQIEAMQR